MLLNLDRLKLQSSNLMEHHQMSPNQSWRSDLTETSFSQQQSQLFAGLGMLSSEPSGSQVDQAGASREVPNGRKRRGRIPTQTPEQKRMKKILADRESRKKHMDEFRKLRAIASRYGGVDNCVHEINQMEAELRRLRGSEQDLCRLEQMKYKFGGIEEMDSKLHRFNQIASMLGGIDEIVPEINRLKNIELQHIKYEQMGSLLNQNAQPFFDFLQQQPDYHGMPSVNFNNKVQGSMPMVDWLEDYEISEMFPAAESGTMPNLVYSDALVTEFIDDNVMSPYGFNDLLGECQTVGEYTFPWSLLSNVNNILP